MVDVSSGNRTFIGDKELYRFENVIENDDENANPETAIDGDPETAVDGDSVKAPVIENSVTNHHSTMTLSAEDVICIENELEPPMETPNSQTSLEDYSNVHTLDIREPNTIGGCQNKDESTTFKYCRFIGNHVGCIFVLTLVLHLSIILTTIILISDGYSVFPIDFQDLPIVLPHDKTHTQDLAWRYSMEFENKRENSIEFKNPSKKWLLPPIETVEIILEGNDILSVLDIKLINKTELKMFYEKGYQKSYCKMNVLKQCQKPISLLRLFDGSLKELHPDFNEESVHNVSGVICLASKISELRPYLLPLLEKNYDPCDFTQKIKITRIIMPIDWNSEQNYNEDTIREFLAVTIGEELQNIRDTYLRGKLELYYFSIKMYLHDVKEAAFINLKLGIGSFAFIFLFMWIRTTSFWITFFGILSIGTSFLLTNLIYRFVLGYQYFGFFHIISLFVILGVGADDIFIFFDTWTLLNDEQYKTQIHRLEECYRKAAKTTFVTSLTTMAAFFVSAFSPLLPVSSFGIFTGMLIGINYLFDVICCPIVYLTYSSTIRPLFDKLCCRKRLAHTASQCNLVMSDEIEANFDDREEQSSRIEVNKNVVSGDEKRIVVFFKSHFYRFIIWKPVRILIPIIFVCFSIYFCYQATTLKPDSSQVKIFRDNHNYAKALRLHYTAFQGNFEDENTKVHLSWGLKPRNMEDCNEKDSDILYCKGKPAYDDKFDLNPIKSQAAFMNLCKKLENLTEAEIDAFRIRRNDVTNIPEISCFMPALYRYIQESFPTLNLKFPFTPEFVTDFMSESSHIYNVSCIPPDFDRYFEILVSHWLTNGYTYVATEDIIQFGHLIGEEVLPEKSIHFYRSGLQGIYGTKLKFVAIEINTTLDFHHLSYTEGKPVYQQWENLIKEEVKKMPSSLSSGFQSTTQTWHFVKVQEILSTSAVRGLFIGILLAFPILTVTTFNIVIGFLATICITMVTAVVVGLIPVFGWKLGVLESINLSLVVGLAVDYVVHFAEAYRTAPFSKRKERVKSMLEHMGISVLSGAITTFGAAVFMLFSEIQFSFQFGIFVMSTVGISFLFSLLFFTTFMATFGPQENTGSLYSLFRMLKCKIAWYRRKYIFKSELEQPVD